MGLHIEYRPAEGGKWFQIVQVKIKKFIKSSVKKIVIVVCQIISTFLLSGGAFFLFSIFVWESK